MKKISTRTLIGGALVAVALLLVLVSRFTGDGGNYGYPTSTATYVDTGDSPAPDSSQPADPASPAGPRPSGSAADDHGDDGTDDPIEVKPTVNPAARESALGFAAAWLNTFGRSDDAWRQGIMPRVTDDLAADLAEADPDTVPSGGRAGAAELTAEGSLTTATVTVVAAGGAPQTLGTLTLDLVEKRGTWLVSSIDWAAAR